MGLRFRKAFQLCFCLLLCSETLLLSFGAHFLKIYCFCLFGPAGCSLLHAGSLVAACGISEGPPGSTVNLKSTFPLSVFYIHHFQVLFIFLFILKNHKAFHVVDSLFLV